jgi:hypothetical protein
MTMAADGRMARCSLLDVRYGSKADIGRLPGNVRFTPESGHRNRPAYSLRRSNSGSLAIFAATRRASSFAEQLGRRSPARLVLELDVSELLAVVIAHDIAGVNSSTDQGGGSGVCRQSRSDRKHKARRRGRDARSGAGQRLRGHAGRPRWLHRR